MNVPKTILVPVDFSETSERALAYARVVARPLGAKLHLLHVVLDPYSLPWLMKTSGADVRRLMDTWETQTQQRLEELRPDKKTAVATKVGHPSLEIVRYVKTHDIDLIVMGTHGHGGVVHMLLGSVAERVVRTAPCPVLTVRGPVHEFTKP